jgi:NADH-quinone oxidoreductase subunit E
MNNGGICMKPVIDYNLVDTILEKHAYAQSHKIAILQDIQKQYRYLPREAFPYLAQKLKISEANLYSVATFYENFSLEPKGKYIIRICDGTACHVRKSVPILECIRKELALSDTKHSTDDLLFTVETVSCLGACGLAPVLTLNDKVHPAMTPEKAKALITELREAEKNV